MTLYCLKAQYTAEALGSIIESGSNREEEARKAVASLGGEMHGFYGMFGDPDGFHVMLIAEFPGNAEYLATLATTLMAGVFEKVRTNVLYTAGEIVEASAIVKAAKVAYEPPKS